MKLLSKSAPFYKRDPKSLGKFSGRDGRAEANQSRPPVARRQGSS